MKKDLIKFIFEKLYEYIDQDDKFDRWLEKFCNIVADWQYPIFAENRLASAFLMWIKKKRIHHLL